MKRNGFTLIEILSVIAIIGVLSILIVPNVIGTLKRSRDDNFLSEAQAVYKSSKSAYVLDSNKGYYEVVYKKGFPNENGIYSKELDLSDRDDFKYMLRYSESGNIYYYIVEDREHKIELGDKNNKNEVVKFEDIAQTYR